MGFTDGYGQTENGIIYNGDVETDVPDIKGDGKYNNLPIFNVDKNDFSNYNSRRHGRSAIAFKDNTNVSDYLKQTRTKNSFYIRDVSNGDMKKVKGKD